MDATCQAYNPQTCDVTGQSGTLPFTGVSITLMLIIAVALIIAGSLMYWRTHTGGSQ